MINCNYTAEFLRELNRMCKSKGNCQECEIYRLSKGKGDCWDCTMRYPEKVMKAVEKWSDDHPRKTWEDRLLELLPNADEVQIEANLCPGVIFGRTAPGSGTCENEDQNCVDCWLLECKEG